MTKKLDELSDREIDALVAEHIFCKRKERVKAGGKRVTIWHDGYSGGPLPHYSTDISAAWEVVKKNETRWLVFNILQ